LNETCDEPPAYETRHFKPSAQNLKLPDWKPLDASKNLDLLKWSLKPYRENEDREFRWKKEEERIRAAAKVGTVRLFRADVDGINPRGGTYTVYRIENINPAQPTGPSEVDLFRAGRANAFDPVSRSAGGSDVGI
jgi:hypothetical protein